MNHKKIVKFHISNKEFYTGEFHENTKLRMLKAYFKDISHFPKFKFIFNGETLEEEEKTIREILRGSHSNELFLKVSLQSGTTSSSSSTNLINDKVYLSQTNISYNANSETTKKHSNSNLITVIQQPNNSLTSLRIQSTNEILIKENYNLKSKTNELESNVKSLQEENVNLVGIIKEMNDNLLMLQKAYDNSNSQNFSLNKKIDQMKVEYIELESAFYQLKEKYEKYTQSPKNRKSNAVAEGKRKSLEKNELNLQSYQAKRMSRENDLHVTQNTHGNIPTGGNITLTQENKSENNKKSSIKKSGFAQGPTHTSSSVPERKSFNKDIEVLSTTGRKGSLNPQNGGNQIAPIIKNETVSTNNKIYSLENLKRINCELSKNFRAIKSDYKSKWVEILKYLNPKDQMNLSLSNKEMLKTVGFYWYDISYAKIENINQVLVLNTREYELILKDHNFALSASTNTALRMLDHSKYTDVFSNDNSYFNNINLLPVYRLLFQFSKICDDNLHVDTDQFINKFKLYFKENSKKLSQVLKAIPNICDFSDVNIEKIKQITDFYNISSIDCAMLGKMCKTTGILGFLVKDALAYCGLESTLERKIRFEPKDKERINIIRDNIEIKEMRSKYEKIQETLEQIIKKMRV